MKIGVCLKQIPATDSRIRIDSPSSGVSTADVKWEISAYDEYALEEGLKLRDAGVGTEVIVFTIGGAETDQRLRDALARGADRAVRLDDPAFAGSDSLGKARILAAAAKLEGVGLLLCGRQAIDGDNAQVPAMIAEVLGWPQALVVSKLEISGGRFRAWRVIGGGARAVVEGPLPAVIAATKGLNEPRFASLKGIMAAKRKPITTADSKALGLDPSTVGSAAALVTESAWGLPPERPKGRILAGDNATVARELVRLLREEAKVI